MAQSGPMTPPETAPTTTPLRARFLDAGMRVLARDGYAGFKQSVLCAETGLTTGAFYHSFRSWKEFEAALIEHWRGEATDRLVAWVDTQPSPQERVDALIEVALSLPHDTEAAIRVWAAGAPQVRAALTEVDAVRTAAVARFIRGIGIDAEHADRLAANSMLLLIGHEASGGPLHQLEWSIRHALDTDPQVTAALAALPGAGDAAQTSE